MAAKEIISEISDQERALLAALKTFPATAAAKAHLKILPTDFVLKHGFLYTPTRRPKDIRKGTEQECFANAMKLLTERPNSLVYCEGYAQTATGGMPIKHGWVTDGSGRAIDNTWTNGVAYAGVPLQTKYVLENALKYESYVSMIDDWEHGHPLLRDLADRPEEWLEPLGAGRVPLSQ